MYMVISSNNKMEVTKAFRIASTMVLSHPTLTTYIGEEFDFLPGLLYFKSTKKTVNLICELYVQRDAEATI